MRWRTGYCVLGCGGWPHRSRLPCRRSALSGLAVRPGQGAGGLARRGLGRARRSVTPTSKWKDDPKVSALVRTACGAAHPARSARRRRSRNFCRQSAADKNEQRASCCSPGCSKRSTPSARGDEWPRAHNPQAARGRRQGSQRHAWRCRHCRTPPAKDQAKIDELGNQLVWETRIFEDRRRVIKFVCEVPTAIDQRLFALGRVIQQEME